MAYGLKACSCDPLRCVLACEAIEEICKIWRTAHQKCLCHIKICDFDCHGSKGQIKACKVISVYSPCKKAQIIHF